MAKLDYGNGYNEENSIAIIWSIEDVRQVLKNFDTKLNLSDKECMEILKRVEDKQDCNFGITWEDISWLSDRDWETSSILQIIAMEFSS